MTISTSMTTICWTASKTYLRKPACDFCYLFDAALEARFQESVSEARHSVKKFPGESLNVYLRTVSAGSYRSSHGEIKTCGPLRFIPVRTMEVCTNVQLRAIAL